MLTFAERVEYQRKIEEVYWRHRIWPKERTDAKPPLERVMSAQRIEEKVRDNLRSSRVLDDYWQRPISSPQLQAEMERMAQQTKNPEMLRELFEALGNDPFVIAECLARPALSERLANQLYSTNAKSGSELKQGLAGQSEPVFAGYLLPAVTGAGSVCTDNTWSPLIDLPARRSQHTAVWTGSEMIVWGGFNYDQELGTGDRYNPATNTWSKVSQANAPISRGNHTAVWTGTEMIVWGGYKAGNFVVKSGGRYDPVNDSWKPTSLNNAPTPRDFHTALWTGSVMLIWGGEDPNGFANTGGRYDPNTDLWSAMNTTNAPVGRFQHSMVWNGSEMIVWGGRNCAVCYLNDGAKYNPASDTWTATSATNAPGRRFGHSAVWTGTEMILWGGWNGTALNDGARYNPATNSWTELTAINPPAARYSHSGIWTGSEMIVWGGNAVGQTNTGARYNPLTNVWTPMSLTNAPSVRDTHSTIWTGNEMIVFGGGYGETLATGGRYDPTANTWTPVRTTNTPQGRGNHTAVWTGSEVIVWGGGNTFAQRFDSGGRYDPALDAWTPTSLVNAPAARQDHTAVWTGNQMIIWGGWNTDGILNTGGRYDPATDNWTQVTVANAPDRRRWHSSVWAGSEMIVWGGESGVSHGPVNTGGRYNPNTDNWVATSTTNAPAPRLYHSAVWTGSEMIVWGGGAYTASNTGGKYNRDTDSWTATSTIGPPSLAEHTSIWTGKEMIVWGGYNGSRHVNIGARYTPGTDTWSATSLLNAPDARIAHIAVWTGDEMIVWGGYNYEQDRFWDTGGRYSPTFDSWTATTTSNAPNRGNSLGAVWTGSRMIVFGGYVSFDASGFTHSFALSTGGAYCANFTAPPVRLANISTRAFVQTGDNVMIGGLIITGSGPKKVVLRAIGPSLSNSGVSNPLQNPALEVHDSSGGMLAINDNWADVPNKQALIDSGLAPTNNLESAVLISLNPGSYTIVVRGVNDGTGTAVVEAYDLDPAADSKFGNISTRAFVQTGESVMIGGLIVSGSGSENVVVRAIGPSLSQFGIPNFLADPVVELHDSNGALVGSNDNWTDASNKQAIIDSGLAPGNNSESAILTNLNPGSYTAVIHGANDGTGVAVVEVYGLN